MVKFNMSIDEIIKTNTEGLYFGNRLILPFKAHFLKVIINDKIITDFSPAASGISVVEEDKFTNLYFNDYKFLIDEVTEFEVIKLLLVEKGKDIFKVENHKKIIVSLKEKHKAKIEAANDDILFID
jgi:hypothetical protein